MNAKECYNNMIETIENLARLGKYEKTRDIAEQVVQKCGVGLGYRDMNTIFTYLTGDSIQNYIRERRLMVAYSHLISGKSFYVEDAIALSGYDNQSSFGKAFQECFNMSPKEAYAIKDKSLITPPKDWGVISGMDPNVETECMTKMKEPITKFGIDKAQYKMMLEAADMQALYEFDDSLSEIAYEIAVKYNTSIKNAFEFVDDFCIYQELDRKNFSSHEEKKKAIMSCDRLIRTCVTYDLSISQAHDLLCEVLACGYSIDEISEDFIRGYLSNSWFNLSEYIKAAEDFLRVGAEDFGFFLESVHMGYSPEEAAAMDLDLNEIEKKMATTIMAMGIQPQNFDHEYTEFDKWADDETSW